MSFSNDVKNEIARLEGLPKCCEKAELFGLLRLSGAVSITGSGVGINFTTENAALARRMLQLLKNNFAVETEVIVTRSQRLKKNNRYQVKVIPSAEAREALKDLQLLTPPTEGKRKLLRKQCCRKAFLRGSFLAGGSVSKPSGDYHLELVTENEELAKVIQKMMQSFSLIGKITERKNDFVIYLKEGDAIISFMSIIGAHRALMEFENVRIVKEMRNSVNRAVNCETANLNKIVRAALEQIDCINYLEQHYGLINLPHQLYAAALLRKEHPEASVAELAALTEDKISKSGFNHRLKKLVEMAQKLGMDGNHGE